MALSGAQLAYKDARSARARSGATRANYYGNVNVIVTISGTDLTSRVEYGTLTIAQVVGEEPDTARFSLVPSPAASPPIPSGGQIVSIALGSPSNVIFGGQVLRATARWVQGVSTSTPWWDIECTDYARLANRRLVTQNWSNVSATQIAVEIIDGYTSGFTRQNVATGLATLASFQVTNQTVTGALVQLANAIDGSFYFDGARDLHFFGSSGDTGPGAGTAPLQITSSRRTNKGFLYTIDVSQIRTRVIVEGASAGVAIDLGVGAGIIPIDTGAIDFPGTGTIRVGGQRINYGGFIRNDPGAILFDAAEVTSAAAPGDTTLAVSDTSAFHALRALQIGDQYITATGASTLTGPGNITGIPATSAGSIMQPIAVGATVILANQFTDLTDPDTGAGTSLAQDVKTGEQIPLQVQVDDALAQGLVAAVEGGDGIHVYYVQDGRYNYDGALARANAELTQFKAALATGQWETEDMNARAGRYASIVVNLSPTSGVVGSMFIVRSELTFPKKNYLPRRRCDLSPLKLASILDAIVTKQ